MPTVRLMFVMQGASLLPEDRFVNVFHFHDPSVGDDGLAITNTTNVLEDALTNAISGGNSMGNFISPYASRTAKIIGYNLLQAEPRVPVERTITLGSAVGAGLPEEVAIVLSTHGLPPVTARRRGRMYFGPLSTSSSTFAGATTALPARPAQESAGQVVQSLIAFAQFMIAESAAIGMPWCIRSTVPAENFVPIVGGYVDNAFDTQRRRGPRTTGRMTFGT